MIMLPYFCIEKSIRAIGGFNNANTAYVHRLNG
jgi:hypothetical protein